MRNYIAYGSNLNIGQMTWRCPGAEIVGVGEIKDYRLSYKGSQTGAYLTIEPARGESVPVAVWAVSAANEHNLDLYEGYPKFYYKKNMTVVIGGKKVKGFVYIMQEDRSYAMPHYSYIDTCADGYADFCLDIRKLNEAWEYTWCKVNGVEYDRALFLDSDAV